MSRNLFAVLAAVGLVAAPISATAAQRVSSPVEDGEQLRGSPVIPIVLIAIILAALIVATNGSDGPVSP